MKLLEGKTALVTGAARGIGKAVAMKFAQEGANIAFTDLVLNDDMAAGLEATRKEIEALGVTCKAYAGNASDFAETEAVVKQIKEDFGSIDILVNNAGITKDGLMLRMSEAAVGCRAQRKPQVSLQLHPCLRTDHAASAWRLYHQYVIRCGRAWQRRPVQLLRIQSRYDRPRQEYSTGAGSQGHSRQRRSTGIHRDRHDSTAAGRGAC